MMRGETIFHAMRTVMEHIVDSDPALIRGFAQGVEDLLLQRGRLDFSTRTTLIRRAGRLGLKRFDANLIIASVEHRHQQPLNRLLPHAISHPTSGVPLWMKCAAVVIIQGPIVVAVIWLIRGLQ